MCKQEFKFSPYSTPGKELGSGDPTDHTLGQSTAVMVRSANPKGRTKERQRFSQMIGEYPGDTRLEGRLNT